MVNTTKLVYSLLRGLNLKSVQAMAERPVRLVVVGEGALASEMASKLGSAPWVSVLTGLEGRRPGDVLLRVSRGAPPAETLPEEALELIVSPTEKAKLPGRVTLAGLEPELLQSELAPALLEKAPEDLRLSLARHVPLLRSAYAAQLIERTSRANAVYAASTGVAQLAPVLTLPLGLADIVVLTKNQLEMAYKLALAEGKTGQPNELMKEILSVVGGGFLFRQVARELVGLIPAWGLVPKVAVAYAGTWVIGRTVHLWARHGERAALEDIRGYYSEALGRGRTLAERLVTRFRRRSPSAKGALPEPPVEKPSDEG